MYHGVFITFFYSESMHAHWRHRYVAILSSYMSLVIPVTIDNEISSQHLHISLTTYNGVKYLKHHLSIENIMCLRFLHFLSLVQKI